VRGRAFVLSGQGEDMFFDSYQDESGDHYKAFCKRIITELQVLRDTGFELFFQETYAGKVVRFRLPNRGEENYSFITALCYAKTGKYYNRWDATAFQALSLTEEEDEILSAAERSPENLHGALLIQDLPLRLVEEIRSLLLGFPNMQS